MRCDAGAQAVAPFPPGTGQIETSTKELDMAETKRAERPLSPFMIGSAYRVQMTSASSFGIRVTGLSLVVAFVGLAAWIFTAAFSETWFHRVDWLLTSWAGWIVWALSAWAAWYHLLGGLRHFIYDDTRMMDIETAERLGWTMYIGATVLAVITIIVAAV